MLFEERGVNVRRPKKIRLIALLLMMAVIVEISACAVSKGSIVILENGEGTGFTMKFSDWSAKNKCELSLDKDDVLQFEIELDEGKIDLSVNGKKGSEPYTGNIHKSGLFTVKVSEKDTYEIRIKGRNATGKVKVINLGSSAE